MKKSVAISLLLAGVAASVAMFILGADGKLTELRDYFWAPLPLAFIGLIGLFTKK